MMPVIRVSAKTWERMKNYARELPFASPDDVVGVALDALDEHGLPAPKAEADPKPKGARRGNKLPQKEFRLPLLETLHDLGGKSAVSVIREQIEPKIAPRLSDADYVAVTTGEPRWWNAVCWERSSLVKDGLLKSDSSRGVWELSESGRRFLASRR
jgi:Mrr N-terminal domain